MHYIQKYWVKHKQKNTYSYMNEEKYIRVMITFILII